MHRMFNYRLYPRRRQENHLQRHLDHCRRNPTPLSQYTLNMLLPDLKHEHPEYADVYSQVLQNISKRIRDTYYGFLARREAGLKAGRPRFKSAGRYKSMTYPQSGFKVEGDTLMKVADTPITSSQTPKREAPVNVLVRRHDLVLSVRDTSITLRAKAPVIQGGNSLPRYQRSSKTSFRQLDQLIQNFIIGMVLGLPLILYSFFLMFPK